MGRRARAIATALAALIVFAALPRTSFADPATPVAADPTATAKRRGDEAMEALRYDDALAHYRIAYEANLNAALLYDLARAYEGLGAFPQALDALEEFDDKAPASAKAAVPDLRRRVDDLRNRVAILVIGSPLDGAEIRLGEAVVGKTKPGRVIVRVNTGKQRLTVSRDGYFPFEREVVLTGGMVTSVDAVMAPRTTSAILRVTSPVRGAAVVLDGRAIGTVPAESFATVGAHDVELSREGYRKARRSVVVAAGEKRSIDVPMARDDSILTRWWFWTGVAAFLAVGGVTLAVLTTDR